MGHGQIPPEGKSEQKPNQSYAKLQELGAFLPFQEAQIQLSWGKKMRDAALPPLPVPFLWSRARGALTYSLVEAQPRCRLGRGDASSPTETLDSRRFETWMHMRGERLATPAQCGMSQCIRVAASTLHLPPRGPASPKASMELHQNQQERQTVNGHQWVWGCCTLQLQTCVLFALAAKLR